MIDIKLEYKLGDSNVTILKESKGISNVFHQLLFLQIILMV